MLVKGKAKWNGGRWVTLKNSSELKTERRPGCSLSTEVREEKSSLTWRPPSAKEKVGKTWALLLEDWWGSPSVRGVGLWNGPAEVATRLLWSQPGLGQRVTSFAEGSEWLGLNVSIQGFQPVPAGFLKGTELLCVLIHAVFCGTRNHQGKRSWSRFNKSHNLLPWADREGMTWPAWPVLLTSLGLFRYDGIELNLHQTHLSPCLCWVYSYNRSEAYHWWGSLECGSGGEISVTFSNLLLEYKKYFLATQNSFELKNNPSVIPVSNICSGSKVQYFP